MLQLPEDSVVSDLKITHYAIIPSGQDDNSIQKIPYTGSSIENVLKYNNQTSNFKFSPFTVRVYFEWYDGQDNLMDDAADTEVSQKVNNSEDVNFNILASLSFKQYNGE